MNIQSIYALDTDPFKAAQYHTDLHIARAIDECAHVLSAAHLYLDGVIVAENRIPGLLKLASVAGKWTHWARACSANYRWIHCFMDEALIQFDRRYGRSHSHEGPYLSLTAMPRNIVMDDIRQRFPFFGLALFTDEDIVNAARKYYFEFLNVRAQWSQPAKVPPWWIEMTKERYGTTQGVQS